MSVLETLSAELSTVCAGLPDRLDRLVSGVPMGRTGSAEEVAQAILWLLSEKSSYSTGGIIEAAGGR